MRSVYIENEGIYVFDDKTPTLVTFVPCRNFNGTANIPEKITDTEELRFIGKWAFGNSHVDILNIPESVSNISSEAFNGAWFFADARSYNFGMYIQDLNAPTCLGLYGVSNHIIDEFFHREYENVDRINVAKDNKKYKCIGGDLYRTTSVGLELVWEERGMCYPIIPDDVKSIGKYALCGCHLMTSIDIPSGVTMIGSYAFSLCKSLRDVTFEDCRNWEYHYANGFVEPVSPGDLDAKNGLSATHVFLRGNGYLKKKIR